MARETGKMEQGEMEGQTGCVRFHLSFSISHSLSPIFRAAGLFLLLLGAVGCQVFTTEQTPTVPVRSSPAIRATATVILPTPPPGATLTAMVAAYRRTRTPASVESPTYTPSPAEIQKPTATETPPATAGPSIHVVPEVAEPGTSVEVRGSGWQPGEELALGIGSTVEDVSMTSGQGIARADGTFTATLTVPAGWTGPDAVIIAESVDGQRRAVTRLYVVSSTETTSPTTRPTLPPTLTPTPTFKGWRGEYYDNPNLQGDPIRVRDDGLIDFDWGQGAPAPGVPADAFSVRWTRKIDFLPGGYHFDVQVDDGVRVFIDGELVLDKWQVTSTTSYAFERVLDGTSQVRVEYFDAGGNATIRFEWRYLGRYPNWRASYYANRSLSGSPVIVRDDIAVNFNWGDGSPAPQIPPDNFSARWTRTASFDAGTHRFHALADDGIRVWVDDRLIIDQWHTSTGDTDYVADVYFSGGSREVRIEYYEAGGEARVRVWWENLDAYTGWRGAYFDNQSLSGQPTFVRNDANIDFDWGPNGPNEIGPDHFSARWTDRRGFETGTYHIFAEHDDGARAWVDDRLVLDAWYETGPVTDRGDVELSTGSREVRVEYFEATGDASIRVWWELAPYQ